MAKANPNTTPKAEPAPDSIAEYEATDEFMCYDDYLFKGDPIKLIYAKAKEYLRNGQLKLK